MNTARSVLSCILTWGAHPTVTRFLKGVFESRPTVSRYTETWDVGTVPNTKDVTLKDLTLKTVMLVSLVSAQRGQTIMISMESQITCVMSKPINQIKLGAKSVHIKFTSYSVDPNLCVVTKLRKYLAYTEDLREDCK